MKSIIYILATIGAGSILSAILLTLHVLFRVKEEDPSPYDNFK